MKRKTKDIVETRDELVESLERVYIKVINLLAGSLKSQRDIERKLDQYLNKEKLTDKDLNEIKDAVISRLRELGHYDDHKYTREFIGNIILSSKPRSKMEIKKKLFSKGVHMDIIDKYLSDLDISHEKEAAKKYITKTLKRFKKPLNFKDKNKLIRQALSRGYDIDIIRTLVDSIDSVK